MLNLLRYLAMSSMVIIPISAHSAGYASPPLMFGGSGGSPSAGHFFAGPRGSGIVTGSIGSMATTTLPGSGGQGLLMNNGNGTGTLVVPGGVPQIVTTPR
jgi:hypothetical protein